MVSASLRNPCLPLGVKVLVIFFFPGKFLMLALMFPSMVYLNLPFVHGVKKLVGGAKGDQGLFFLYFILDFPPALLVQKTIVSTH